MVTWTIRSRLALNLVTEWGSSRVRCQSEEKGGMRKEGGKRHGGMAEIIDGSSEKSEMAALSTK